MTTKTGGGADPKALAAMAKVYTDNGGDMGKIAKALGVTFKAGAKVKDKDDFAKQMLAGLIVQD